MRRRKESETIAEKIALYIIDSNRGITNLFLQKILYYIKAIGKLLVEYPIITDECECMEIWTSISKYI